MTKNFVKLISLALCLMLVFSGCTLFEKEPVLSNPDATEEAKKLYDVLFYGSDMGFTLSAQQ